MSGALDPTKDGTFKCLVEDSVTPNTATEVDNVLPFSVIVSDGIDNTATGLFCLSAVPTTKVTYTLTRAGETTGTKVKNLLISDRRTSLKPASGG